MGAVKYICMFKELKKDINQFFFAELPHLIKHID